MTTAVKLAARAARHQKPARRRPRHAVITVELHGGEAAAAPYTPAEAEGYAMLLAAAPGVSRVRVTRGMEVLMETRGERVARRAVAAFLALGEHRFDAVSEVARRMGPGHPHLPGEARRLTRLRAEYLLLPGARDYVAAEMTNEIRHIKKGIL